MIGDIDLEKSLTAAQIVKTPVILNMSAHRKSITAKPTNTIQRWYFTGFISTLKVDKIFYTGIQYYKYEL